MYTFLAHLAPETLKKLYNSDLNSQTWKNCFNSFHLQKDKNHPLPSL